jgi:hypothetical protein
MAATGKILFAHREGGEKGGAEAVVRGGWGGGVIGFAAACGWIKKGERGSSRWQASGRRGEIIWCWHGSYREEDEEHCISSKTVGPGLANLG